MACCKDTNCGYYYQLPEERFPCCHFPPYEFWPAPCEEDEEVEEED